MGPWILDIRHSLRLFRRNSLATLIIVMTIAAGIGVKSVIYSILESMFLQPLPFPEAHRLVLLGEYLVHQLSGGPLAGVRYLNYLDWREQSTAIHSMGAYQRAEFNLSSAGKPDMAAGCRVDAGYFPTLKVQPQTGRSLLPAEYLAGNSRVVLLSHDCWQNRFQGRHDVIGQVLRIDGTPFSILGVLPENFRMPAADGTPVQLPIS